MPIPLTSSRYSANSIEGDQHDAGEHQRGAAEAMTPMAVSFPGDPETSVQDGHSRLRDGLEILAIGTTAGLNHMVVVGAFAHSI